MAKEIKLITPQQDIVENTGNLMDDEVSIENTNIPSEDKEQDNSKLLEQINQLDLLLSLKGDESNG